MKRIIKVIFVVLISLLITLEIGNVIYYYNYQKPNLDRINNGGFGPWDLGRSYKYRPWITKFYDAIFNPPERYEMNT